MKKLNLQLFAEEEDITNEESTEETPSDEETLPDEESTEENISTEETDPEPELIPKNDVQKIVSKRVNELNDKYKDYEKYKKNMDRLIQMSGLSEEAFYAQLDQVEIQNKAQKMGVSPEVAKQMAESQKALQEAQQTTMAMKYQMEEQALKSNPLYEDYDKVKDQVRELANNSGMSLEQAYWAMNGPALVEKQTKLTEQRLSHNQKYKTKRNTVENDGNDKTPNAPGTSLNENQKKIASELGISADEYALYNNDDLTYDDIIKMKKKK